MRNDIILGVATIVVGVVSLLGANYLQMPESMGMVSVVVLVCLYLAFMSVVWKEKPADEREEQHIAMAGRLAFIVGVCCLLAGIVVQSLNHKVDIWLYVGLLGMTLTKLLTRIYLHMTK